MKRLAVTRVDMQIHLIPSVSLQDPTSSTSFQRLSSGYLDLLESNAFWAC